MSPEPVQLALGLSPRQPYSLDYFVPHSGVAEAYAALEQALENAASCRQYFQLIFVWGLPGSGKKHLLEGFCQRAAERGIPQERIYKVFFKQGESPDDDEVSQFVRIYEQMRASGGLIFGAAILSPDGVTSNPHLLSRLTAGSVFELSYPREDELAPLLSSLLERKNLKLPSKTVDYVLKRLPRDPLSFEGVFARISELCFRQGKTAGPGIVRQVLDGADE